MTNGYLLVTDAGQSIVIDAPEGMAAWIADRGVSPEVLILTHAHFDHVVDAAAIREAHDCPVWAHSPFDPALALVDLLKSMGLPSEIPPYAVDEILEGQDRLTAGGLDFRLLHVPGHSPDSLCLSPAATLRSSEAILLAGDVLFHRGIGRTDFPHSDHDQLLRGIREKVLTLPDETEVYPGHGPPTTIREEKRENPFLS